MIMKVGDSSKMVKPGDCEDNAEGRVGTPLPLMTRANTDDEGQ